MKNAIAYLGIAVVWTFLLVLIPQNTMAQAKDPVETAEQKLKDALDALQEAVESARRHPNAHGPDNPLEDARKAVKDAARALDIARTKQKNEIEDKIEKIKEKINRERNERKKEKLEAELKKLEQEKERDDKVRDALEKWADAAKKAAEAPLDKYDEAKEALDKAKKALDHAKAVRDATKKVHDLEDALAEENNRRPRRPAKIVELEDALKKAKEDLEKLQKQEGVKSVLPETPNDQGQSSRNYYFVGALTGALPFGDLDPQTVGLPELQGVLFAPSLFPQIMERLGSEFYPGTLSGETPESYTLQGRASFSPGLRIGLGIGEWFEIRAQGQRFQTGWSGSFPVSVFPFDGSAPHTVQGSLNSSTEGFIAESDLAFFLSSGMVRPYLKAGGRGFFPTDNSRWASLAGIDMPLETPATTSTFSAFGGGGVRIGFLKNGFVELGATYGKVPGAGYLPGLDFAAGWRFGGNKARKPLPVNLNADQDPPKKRCNCESLTAKILIQNLTRHDAIQKEIEEKKALLADEYLDEVQKQAARTALAALEQRLSDKVYEEERDITQDGALPASIVSRIAEAGDQVKVKIKALDIGSKLCHCTNPDNVEPDCIFKLIAIAEDDVPPIDGKFRRVEEGALKYTTVWSREFDITNQNPTIKFTITGKCEKPNSNCDPSDPAGRGFVISFRKADVHDK